MKNLNFNLYNVNFFCMSLVGLPYRGFLVNYQFMKPKSHSKRENEKLS
jgi:hypothetical protein